MLQKLRQRLYIVIFEADTPAGKAFDVVLLLLIVLSVASVMLESVPGYQKQYGVIFQQLEWWLTGIFTLEYILRLVIVKSPAGYARSFYGVVDLLAVLPSYFSLILTGTHSLMVIRALRLLRIFRILKITRYSRESSQLLSAIIASRHKVFVFLFVVLNIIIIMGTLMYLVEGSENGFSSIPQSIYWAIVTITTVGYGDIAPGTNLGRFIASLSMIIGYAILAVPTGIVSHEISKQSRKSTNTRVCPHCLSEGHDNDANYCKHCGKSLEL